MGPDRTAMNFRLTLPEIRWQQVCPRVLSYFFTATV